MSARIIPINPERDGIDLAALRALASDSDAPCVSFNGRALKRLVAELDRIPVMQAELAGRRTVDVVVAGIVR